MVQRILTWVVILGVGLGGLYAYEETRVPCREPLAYALGQFDERFGLTREEFRQVVSEAEMLWESALGRDLFRYDAEAPFLVNLIFDERQERTLDQQKLAATLETTQDAQAAVRKRYETNAAALDALRADYDAELVALKQSLDRYNARVAKWNASDRTDEDELDWLRREEKRLDRSVRDVEELRQQVNAAVGEVNRYAKEEEKVVERYNAELDTFTQTYGAGGAFDQGMYQGASIDIYQFDDRDHLRLALVHELGHALGLDHVANPRSVMYPVVSEQDVAEIALSPEDRTELDRICSVTAVDLLLRDSRAAWSKLRMSVVTVSQ